MHERLHECGAERIGAAERLAVAVGQQDVAGEAGQVVGAPERIGDPPRRLVVDRTQDALLGDQLQVAVLERDRGEPAVPVGQLILERQGLRSGPFHADQLTQVALPRDEADDRDGAVGIRRLDELGDLLGLPCDEHRIRDLPGEPEHELVEEQDDAVVAQPLGVGAERREPAVERDEGVGCACDRVDEVRHEHRDDVADQSLGELRVGRRGERGIEPLDRPRRAEVPPFPVRVLGQPGKERLVPHAVVDRLSVVEQSLGPVDRGKRCAGMLATHVLDVPTEDRRLEALGTDEVVGHEHEAAGVEPAVAGDGVGQLRSRPGGDVAVEQGVEHGHEVALARAERSVQVAGLRPVLRQRRPDETQRLVEGHPQLRRDHVGVQGGLDVLHALGEAQHEVTLVDLLRDADELAQQRLPGLHRCGRHRRVPPRRPRRCDSSAEIAVACTVGDQPGERRLAACTAIREGGSACRGAVQP